MNDTTERCQKASVTLVKPEKLNVGERRFTVLLRTKVPGTMLHECVGLCAVDVVSPQGARADQEPGPLSMSSWKMTVDAAADVTNDMSVPFVVPALFVATTR